MRLQPLIDALRDLLLSEPALHADETPVPMLAPGKKTTHRAYLWAYATTPYAGLKAVIYDFSEGRGGQHARDFLCDWQGKLICDDYSGYKQSFAIGVTRIVLEAVQDMQLRLVCKQPETTTVKAEGQDLGAFHTILPVHAEAISCLNSAGESTPHRRRAIYRDVKNAWI